MLINEDECIFARLDIKKVQSIARRISTAAKEAETMGIHIFGGSGKGTLRFRDGGDRALIVAHIDGGFDGGDGGCVEDNDGYLRGE